MTKRQLILLVLILIVALSLRIAVALHVRSRPLTADEPKYDNIARHLIAGDGYQRDGNLGLQPTAICGPTYVLFVAGCYKLFGVSKLSVLIPQALLDTLSCLIAFGMGKTLFRRVDVGVVSAFLFAVYPPFIIASAVIMTETFVVCLCVAGIYAWARWELDGVNYGQYLGAALMAMAALSRPTLMPVPLFFALCSRRAGSSVRTRARAVVVQMTVLVLVISPWVVRNYLVFDRFIPSASNGGFTFWGGSGPANGRVVPGIDVPYCPEHVCEDIKDLSEMEQERYFYHEGVRVIRSAPSRFAVLTLKKIPRLWLNLMHDDPPSKESLAFAVYSVACFVFTWLGITRLHPSQAVIRLLYVLIGWSTLMHMVYFSLARYAYPVYGFLLVFTAAGVVAVFRGASAQESKAVASGSADVFPVSVG